MPKNVSEVTQQLMEIVRDNSGLRDVWIQGEISDVNHARNGNAYFTLRDLSKKIECVIFNDQAPIPKKLPTVGNSISVNGQIQIYRTRSEYRFVVKEINSPENPLPVPPISVSTLTATWENTLEAHSGEVQGEISEVFVTPADFTIFKLKDVTVDGPSDDIIECALPPEVDPSFPLEIGKRVHVKGQFQIFANASAYQIAIDDADNIIQVTGQPTQNPSTLNECQGCHQRFNNLRQQFCRICYDAHLTAEGIVVGAVIRYFNASRFENFSIQREYPIRFGANVRGRADVVLLNSQEQSVAIAECKRIGYDGSDRIGQEQLESYLNATGVELGLFADDTDPYEWIFLKKNRAQMRFNEISRSQFERELGVELAPEIPPTKTQFELVHSNIIKSEVDAIVNAADPRLTRGTGVDGTIRDAGGEEIDRECQEIFDREGVCPPGKAVITTGGDLPARYVIHTVGPIWQDGNRSEPDLLADCYKNSLQLAVENGIRSIAFPAISTGNFGYPIEKATSIALNAVKKFVEQAYQNNEIVPERIQFVLFDQEAYACYVKELSNLGFGLSCQIG